MSGKSQVSLRSVSGQSKVSRRSVAGQSQVSHRSVAGQLQVSLRLVSGQSQVRLRSLCAYFVRQTEPKILRLVSCKDTALQVLMSFRLSVCLSVAKLKIYLFTAIYNIPKVTQGYICLPKVTHGYPKLLKVPLGYPRFQGIT